MNKEGFIKELENMTGLKHSKCVNINNTLENNFIIGKNNKEKIVSEITLQLGVTSSEADKIYESSMSIVTTEVKNKLKHPFKSQD